MPRTRQTKAPTARRAYKTARKAAVYANKLARVVSAPARRERRRVAGNQFLAGAGKMLAPVANAGIAALTRRAMSVISGQGDYQIGGISHNSLLGKMSPTVPQFSQGDNGSIRIQHREYITDILSTTDFAVTEYQINPALTVSFPWLSRIAQQFEQYRINGMIYEFKSGSSDSLNSTNTALGYVIGAVEYNALANSFTNKLEMENAIFCSSTKPSLSMITAVECAPSQTPLPLLYTRLGFENLSASDLRLYDLGRFSLATVGQQAVGSNIGELWVSYDIQLFKTRFIPPGVSIPTFSTTFVNTVAERVLLGLPDIKTNTLNLALSQVFDVKTNSATSTFTFPPGSQGSYLFNYQVMGAFSDAKSFTKPFSNYNPFINLVNVTPRLYYPDETKIGLLDQQLAYNNTTVVSSQTPSSLSQFLTFQFTIVNNNIPSAFSVFISQTDLSLLTLNLAGTPAQIGVCYITQISPDL